MTAAYAILSALYVRNRTGKGQLIDLSQTEAVSSLIGEVLLGYLLTAKIPERMGNAHPRYAPHNLYRCWGVDRWLALEIHSDEEFKILAKIINMPDLAFDSRFSDMASRKKNEKELDLIITNCTKQRDRDWMVEEFCRAGLAAAPSRDARDIYADRHLRDRNTIIKLFHPEMGEIEFMGPPWKMSNCSIEPVHAPILGQHNKYVLNELLGLSEDEISDLRKKEIIL
jgi:crotonobetainyl-CoA:carnitine CoA-transferase CaiB-like acyl-CoA transferase